MGTADAIKSVLSCLEVGLGVLLAQDVSPTIGIAPVAEEAFLGGTDLCRARRTPALTAIASDDRGMRYTRAVLQVSTRFIVDDTNLELIVR
jgi:hypothetical protein